MKCRVDGGGAGQYLDAFEQATRWFCDEYFNESWVISGVLDPGGLAVSLSRGTKPPHVRVVVPVGEMEVSILEALEAMRDSEW